MWITLGIVLVAFVVFVGFTWISGQAEPQSFGHCLSEQEVTMYGVDWCPNCQDQKRLFGEDFANVNYINCDFQKELCRENGVTMYPVWSKGNAVLIGFQSFDRLSELSGCPLP